MTYHIGVYKGCGSHYNGSRADTLVLQAVKCIDSLSCQTWLYFGKRTTTKKELRAKKAEILKSINRTQKTNFSRLIIK